MQDQPSNENDPAPPHVRIMDPATGRQISPVTAASLCVKPRGQMTERQLASLAVLKAASHDFRAMRSLAMRLWGLLRGGTVETLDTWLQDARASNIHGMRRFARTIRQDMDAVSNAAREPCSNGQAEAR